MTILLPKDRERQKGFMIIGLILAIFGMVMLQFVNMPYYWDELGVYCQAILYQYDHHVSLLPGSVPPGFSHGHPLLFTFLYALAFKLFTPHLWVGHVFSLLISISVAITAYAIAEKNFSQRVGIFAVLFLLVQPLFVAQSTLLLPEMLLSLWVLLTVKAIIEKKYLSYYIFASLAVLTKETGIILPVVAISSSLVFQLMQGRKPYFRWREWLIYLTPLVTFAIFLAIQRLQNGWFLFPYHIDLISFSGQNVLTKLSKYMYFLFCQQGRVAITILLMFTIVQWCYFYATGAARLGSKSIPFAAVVLALLIPAMLAFSSVNFLMYRYLLLLLPALCILGGAALDQFKIKPWLKALMLVIIVALCAVRISVKGFDFDNNMGYRHMVYIQKEATHFMEENHMEDKAIMSSFNIYYGLINERAGYLNGPVFTNQVTDPDSADYICVFVSYDMQNFIPKKHNTVVIKSFEESGQEIRLYQVLPNPM